MQLQEKNVILREVGHVLLGETKCGISHARKSNWFVAIATVP